MTAIAETVLSFPSWKFAPILLAASLVLIELKRNIDGDLLLWDRWVLALTAISVITSCGIVVIDEISAREERKQHRAWQKERLEYESGAAMQRTRIEAQGGDHSVAERYLQTLRGVTQSFAKSETTNAVDELFSMKDELLEIRAESKALSERVAQFQLVRVQPVADLVVAKIDSWISGLKQRGIQVEILKHIEPIETVVVQPHVNYNDIRSFRFPTGETVTIRLRPLCINEAQVVSELHFSGYVSGGEVVVTGALLNIQVKESSYYLGNNNRIAYSFEPVSGDHSNPMEDERFVESINESIDQIMGFLVKEIVFAED